MAVSFWMQLILVCRYLTLVCRYLTVQALGPLIGWRTKDLDEEDLKVGEHFEKIDRVDPAHKEWIMKAMYDVFTSKKRLMKPIAICMGNIMAKMATLMSGSSNTTAPNITSEAELRFAVADPIIEMLCNSWGYQVIK